MPPAPEDPQDRRTRILDAARAAFLRFGFERTSMGDIAAGAGVSRTALYHYFPGKEDVARAVVEDFTAKTLANAARVLNRSKTLAAALTGLLEAKFAPALAIVSASPHGEELVGATHHLWTKTTRTADADFHALVIKALVTYGKNHESEAVAETLIAAAKGLMKSGETHVTKAKFKTRIDRLVAWALS